MHHRGFLLSLSLWLVLQVCAAAYSHEYKIVDLPKKTQEKVQAHFDEIFEKIRIPSDPEKAPEIIVVKNITNSYAAFVDQYDSEKKVYVSINHLALAGPEELVITYAHELRHFNKEQVRRAKENADDYKFLNEADAQVMSFIERIGRYGFYDEQGNPEPMPYKLEPLIRVLERDSAFRDDYLNHQTIASGLKQFLFVERKSRTIPTTRIPRGPLWKLKWPLIRTALWISLKSGLSNLKIRFLTMLAGIPG